MPSSVPKSVRSLFASLLRFKRARRTSIRKTCDFYRYNFQQASHVDDRNASPVAFVISYRTKETSTRNEDLNVHITTENARLPSATDLFASPRSVGIFLANIWRKTRLWSCTFHGDLVFEKCKATTISRALIHWKKRKYRNSVVTSRDPRPRERGAQRLKQSCAVIPSYFLISTRGRQNA